MIVSHRSLLVVALSALVIGQAPELVLSQTDPKSRGQPTHLGGDRRKVKEEVLKAFEANLLRLFGLKQRPGPSRKSLVPQYMLDLYSRQNTDPGYVDSGGVARGAGLLSANTVRSFYHRDSQDEDYCKEADAVTLWFNISNIADDEILTSAEIRILHNASSVLDLGERVHYRVEVHEIMRPNFRSSEECITRLIDTKRIDSHSVSWDSFDVHPAVLKWKKSPYLNYGLLIRIASDTRRPSGSAVHQHLRIRRSATMDSTQWHSERPLLVTYTDDGRGARTRTRRDTKRSGHSKRRSRKVRSRNSKRRSRKRKARRRKSKKNECKRHPLYVDFKEVGWEEWIVAPSGYQAYYCQGDCSFPIADHLNSTNHAIVQTLVNSVDPSAVPRACCVPTKLSSISMLYVDEQLKVVLKNYQEMVVQACGCR